MCFATIRKVAGSIPAGVSGSFIDIKSFRSHFGPGVDSASNRNEYRERFLGDKGGRCIRLTTLPPSCAVVMKSGNLNFLEPSGPLQACNGTDFTEISKHVTSASPVFFKHCYLIIKKKSRTCNSLRFRDVPNMEKRLLEEFLFSVCDISHVSCIL